MTRVYSLDLRERVINHIKSGNSQKATVEIFKVSKSTVSRWWIRYKNDGEFGAKKRLGSKGKINKEQLVIYVEANPDKTLAEISTIFNVSIWTIHFWLKKLGFRYKKKPSPTRKRIMQSENNT
jgi:transposase